MSSRKELQAAEGHLIDAVNVLDFVETDHDDAAAELAELARTLHAALSRLQSLLEPPPDVDVAYEMAAARARGNAFADTGGRDWT